MRVRAIREGWDGHAYRKEGDEFDFYGVKGSWMEVLSDDGSEAPPTTMEETGGFTKKEIMRQLDEAGADYSPVMSKADLSNLLAVSKRQAFPGYNPTAENRNRG